jgi:hypothetical protein
VPGLPDLSASPASVATLALGLNDHWFKAAWPGPITCKVSDVVGLVVLPIVLISGVELIRRRPTGWRAATAVSIHLCP